MTNRKDALKQMAKRYQRLEALRTPAERQEDIEATSNSKLDRPYYISPSRNHPVEVIPFVQQNPLDPAKKVSLSLQSIFTQLIKICRTFSPSFKLTSLAVFLGENSMGMIRTHFLQKKETAFFFVMVESFIIKLLAFIIPPTTCDGPTIQSIHEPTPLSWLPHLKRNPERIHFGMHRSWGFSIQR